MSAPACGKFDRLRRRLNCFMGDSRHGRRTVGGLVSRLSQFGEVAIVGGMLRDLLLSDHYGRFQSDVDLVLNADDGPGLRRLLEEYGATENRFGGYALPMAWKVDVWLLRYTWAHVQGYRMVSRVEDILDTTFFNWDAVLYSISRRRFICRTDYLDELSNRLLDLNLEHNPNPIGNCVRTLRYSLLWGAIVAPRLARFALQVMQTAGPTALIAAEARSHVTRRMLTEDIIGEAMDRFRLAALTGEPSVPLRSARSALQWELPLHLPTAVPAAGLAR